MLRVLLHQEIGQRSRTHVVQIELAGTGVLIGGSGSRIVAAQRLDDGLAARLGIRLLHLFLWQRDDHLVARTLPDLIAEGLNAAVADTGLVHSITDAVRRRRRVELDVDQRAALEVDADRNMVPKEDGQQAGHAEDEREAEEIPLLPQPIDVYVVKQFHLNSVYAVPHRHSGDFRATGPLLFPAQQPGGSAARQRALRRNGSHQQQRTRSHAKPNEPDGGSESDHRQSHQMESASPRCLRFRRASKIVRDTKTAVNRFAPRPKTSVTAKPFTGPVPKRKRMAAETIVVTWVSRMVVHACAKPWSTAAAGDLPARSSSRMRSKMSTFESTPMPTVRITPAIPGKVSVAVVKPMKPSRITRFRKSARSALMPAPL